jgi:hypothetical protein
VAVLGAALAFAVAIGLGAAVSCELVLGDLPPVRASADGGGAGGTSTTASTTGTGTGTGTTGTTATSTGGTGGACCDCDDDGYRSEALCAANDCDDHDARVHPGQTMYFATPSDNPNVGFDYDCSGTPDPEYPNPLDCNALMGADCDAGVGFLNAVPPCGATGSWGSCISGSVPLTCQQHVIDSAMVSACH